MRRLIKTTIGIWLLIVVLLVAARVIGHVLDSDGMSAFQSRQWQDTDIFLYDMRTGVAHNRTWQPSRDPSSQHLLSDGNAVEYPIEPQHFVSQGSDVSPAWSPVGRQLAFVSYRDGNSDIYLLNLRNGQLRNLTNRSGMDIAPV
jgi:hypothetical protein